MEKHECSGCSDSSCSANKRLNGESDEDFNSRQNLSAKLCRIKHKIVVLSGKGGVGKSTVAVNLATSLMMSGHKVGLLDVDIHGPSVPTMLGLENEKLENGADGLLPVELGDMKVMSLGFLLRSPDDAVIWRGPMKMGVIRQFLEDVDWGDLDYLIIDSPPGTGDEPLSVCQLIDSLDGAIIVTTPQKVAAVDVRKSVTFCRQLNLPVLGIVENMNGFVCPKCKELTYILPTGSGQKIADDMSVPFLGSIPMDPQIAAACDNGRAFIHEDGNTATAGIMQDIVSKLTDKEEAGDKKGSEVKKENEMRIAIPLAEGKLTAHFGHCASFALLDVDMDSKKILKREDVDAPPHQPGLLPPWLAERGVTQIIAGGMGQRAQSLFIENGVDVLVGAPVETPEQLATDFMNGTLETGSNLCDH
jgi:Mrp family chromosome partitioning ATPase/predicted Fe-Mo cluster-binding NifX family protein